MLNSYSCKWLKLIFFDLFILFNSKSITEKMSYTPSEPDIWVQTWVSDVEDEIVEIKEIKNSVIPPVTQVIKIPVLSEFGAEKVTLDDSESVINPCCKDLRDQHIKEMAETLDTNSILVSLLEDKITDQTREIENLKAEQEAFEAKRKAKRGNALRSFQRKFKIKLSERVCLKCPRRLSCDECLEFVDLTLKDLEGKGVIEALSDRLLDFTGSKLHTQSVVAQVVKKFTSFSPVWKEL